MEPELYDPEVYEPAVQHGVAPYWGWSSLLFAAFWLWMCFDSYRRYGLSNWIWFMLIFWPSTLIYFVTHAGQIFRGSGSGRGLFGISLKSRIRKAQQQLHVADTIAARADLAELYYQAGRYDECEAEFKNVLAPDPQNLEALYYTGLCRIQKKDYAAALEYLQKVMERDRKLRFGVAWLHYTECLIQSGKHAEALEERRKLCRAFPRPLTEYAYAQSLAAAGKKNEARGVLEEMLATCDSAPSEDRVWVRRGKVLLRESQRV